MGEVTTPIELRVAHDGVVTLRVRKDAVWKTAAVDVAIPALVHLCWLLGLHDTHKMIELEIVEPEDW